MRISVMVEHGLRVLIVTEHASLRRGGEASLAYYYFDRFLERGVETWMIVHERDRDELAESFPDDLDRIYFVRDRCSQRLLWHCGKILPKRVADLLVEPLINLITQIVSRGLAQRLVPEEGINVVQQPMPIGPRFPSMMFGLGAPVVMGPLCGGMDFPRGFRNREGRASAVLLPILRIFSHLANLLIPGRILAETLVIAHDMTRRAIPLGARGKVFEVVESGVDLSIWRRKRSEEYAASPPRFVFLGQVRELKGVDLLIDAFTRIADQTEATLEIIGDGDLRKELEARVRRLGLSARIVFRGWLRREAAAARLRSADVLVLPSLRECGGTVVLEAMAVGLPVIATRWGGPAKYLDDTCGILVDPNGEEQFVKDLAEAMLKLSKDRELRLQMGRSGQVRVRSHDFSWDNKVCVVLRILRETAERAGRRSRDNR